MRSGRKEFERVGVEQGAEMGLAGRKKAEMDVTSTWG